MNIKDYIASGIIESYVMGLATEAESAEFEQLCAQYPELVAERKRFEESLESYAARQAQLPPGEMKAKILEAIASIGPEASASIPSSRLFTMENSKNPRSPGLLRFIAAAAVILLVGMVVLYLQANRQNTELVRNNQDLEINNQQLKNRLDTAQRAIDEIRDREKVVSDPNVTVVNMVGTKIAPRSSANVYWDSANTSVYLVVRNMPELPSDKQYQLWALIDGKPKDLGVFDATNKNLILQMKNTKRAQAFAITIGKKGGDEQPDLGSMQSLGKTPLTQ